jgi:hypothetical protein
MKDALGKLGDVVILFVGMAVVFAASTMFRESTVCKKLNRAIKEAVEVAIPKPATKPAEKGVWV